MKKNCFKIVMIMFVCLLSQFSAYSQDMITNVSPNTATAGETGVAVTATLNSTFAPPSTVNPLSFSIGGVSGTSVSRSGVYIYGTFDFSSGPAGSKDVSVVFPGPSGNVTMTLTGGFTLLPSGGGITIYVNAANTAGPWDGTSWATAYNDLQDGISAGVTAGSADIWVAQGTYYPTNTADRTISFEMTSFVNMYGGFDGTETDISERDWTTNVTIISGNIGVAGDNTDNSYHVIQAANYATLDGFTIRDGYANGELLNRLGGAIYFDTESPTISNCIFTSNYAEDGGALYIFNDSRPVISSCLFNGNNAKLGGALICRVGGAATITDCDFQNNIADWRGGAIMIDYGAYEETPVIITGCTFSNNYTDGNGGAIYTDDLASQYQGTYVTIENCVFTSNTAEYRGGGIANFNENMFVTVTNCTFTSNTGYSGGNAISNDYRVTITIDGGTFGTGQDVDSDSSCDVTIL